MKTDLFFKSWQKETKEKKRELYSTWLIVYVWLGPKCEEFSLNQRLHRVLNYVKITSVGGILTMRPTVFL